MDDEAIVCYCSQITKKQILQAIDCGAKTLDDIRSMTNACTVGRCKELNPQKKCCSSVIMKLLESSQKRLTEV